MVGDSRVVKVREVDIKEPGWHVKHRSRSGASMEEIEKIVEEVFQEGRWNPDAIIIFGMMVDICYKTKIERGMMMGIKKEVLDDNYKSYPNLNGVEEKVKKMTKIFKLMWAGVEVFWVLPYPIDFLQYNTCKKMVTYQEGLIIFSEEEKCRDLKNTYTAYLYFQRLEEIMESLVGKDRIFLYRKHCEATLKPNMMTTTTYMKKIKEGHLGLGRVFPAGLSDGLHATLAPAITLMQEILKKVRKVLNPDNCKYKIVRPHIRVNTNMYLPGPVVKPTVSTYINENNPNPKKFEKEKQEKEKLGEEKRKKEKLEEEKRKKEKLEEEKRKKEKLEEIMKLEVCARPKEESTMVEIIKFPCGHVCVPAPRNWWRLLKCAECGGKWSTDEGEVELETLTTIVHHVRLRK